MEKVLSLKQNYRDRTDNFIVPKDMAINRVSLNEEKVEWESNELKGLLKVLKPSRAALTYDRME